MNSLRVTSINKMLDWLNLWCIIYGIAESLIELSRSLKLHRQNWHGASSSGIRFLSELDRDQNWTKKEDEKKVKEDERISETWHDMCWYCFTSAYILTKPLIRQYYKNIATKMYCNAHSGQEKQKEKQSWAN